MGVYLLNCIEYGYEYYMFQFQVGDMFVTTYGYMSLDPYVSTDAGGCYYGDVMEDWQFAEMEALAYSEATFRESLAN